jgi:hypothetical protein
MKKVGILCGALWSLLAGGTSQAQQSPWPPLPDKGFISGRAATSDDVNQGNALFVAKVDDLIIGKPIAITIPQYAYWTDKRGHRVPVVVVQAEEAEGSQLFGFRDAQGKEHVATGPEMTLLGTKPPN